MSKTVPIDALRCAIREIQTFYMPAFRGDKEMRGVLDILKRKLQCLQDIEHKP